MADAQRKRRSLLRLPTDIWLLILHEWIAGADGDTEMLQALSALEAACSKRALRPVIQHLQSHLNYPWKLTTLATQHQQIRPIKQLSSYLQWLADRQVAVKTVFLTKASMADELVLRTSLPFVESVVVADLMECSLAADALSAVLRACPNVTCISCAGWTTEAGLEAALWEVLLSFPRMHLTTLIVRGTVIDTDGLSKVIKMFGHSLTSVAFQEAGSDTLLPVLAHCCKHLTAVEIHPKRITADELTTFLRKCQEITSLVVRGFVGDAKRVYEVVFAANCCLKHFNIDFNARERQGAIPYDCLGRLLHNFDHLDSVTVADCSYQRSTAVLRFATSGLSMEDLRYILSNCGGAKAVELAMHLDRLWRE